MNKPVDISVILPSFRRPEGLEIALKSLMAQKVLGYSMEIIVADNDPKASAKTLVAKLARASKVPIKYLHVPEPGVSNARNGALAAAAGRYLAFLDDDQEAGENWLATLMHICTTYKAGLAFVPTIARIPGRSSYHGYYENFFSRFGPKLDEGLIANFFGCGNSLLDTHLCILPNQHFSTEMNETGGEVDLLFSQLQSQGIAIAWSSKALAYEDIRPHRATPAYVKIRSFAFGQGPSQMAAEAKNPLGVVRWMLVGAVQYMLYQPVAIITKITGHASHIRFLAKAAQGAGKVLWFGGFTPKLYGAAVVENKEF